MASLWLNPLGEWTCWKLDRGFRSSVRRGLESFGDGLDLRGLTTAVFGRSLARLGAACGVVRAPGTLAERKPGHLKDGTWRS